MRIRSEEEFSIPSFRRGKTMSRILRRLAAMNLILMLVSSSAFAERIYVDASASGGANNGASWVDAYTSLQDALGASVAGDEIWVASGTYKPTAGGDSSISFVIPAGISVYGGFAGGETGLSQRDPSLNKTILSGDIGTLDDLSDNSHHVVEIRSATGTRLEGLTITLGYAHGTGEDKHGGGIFCTGVDETNMIVNCILTANGTADGPASSSYEDSTAGSGGGIYLASSSPVIQSCSISLNTTGNGGTYDGNWGSRGGDGAGLYGDAASPVIIGCTFSANITGQGGGGQEAGRAGHGGALCFVGKSTPSLSDCVITSNQTGIGGGDAGGVYNTDIRGSGGDGAGIYCSGLSLPVITDCRIASNSTGSGPPGKGGEGNGGRGGGICNFSQGATGSMNLTNTIITDNSTGHGSSEPGYWAADGGAGGGIYSEANVEMVSCSLSGNYTGDGGSGWRSGDAGNGGGMCLASASAVLTGCTIASNCAGSGGDSEQDDGGGDGGDGGGIYIESSLSLDVTNCLIASNMTGDGGEDIGVMGGGDGGSGAGIFCATSSATISDCTITANQTGKGGGSNGPGGEAGSGGGFIFISSEPSIVNCLIRSNTTGKGGSSNGISGPGGRGAGICCNSSPMSIVSCEIYGNSCGDGGLGTSGASRGGDGGGIFCDSSGAEVINCLVSGNIAGSGGKASWPGGNGGSGGGIYGSLYLINCTVAGNSAGSGGASDSTPGDDGMGGGVFSTDAATEITNSILWGNTTISSGSKESQIDGPATITCSCVEVGTGTLPGEGNTKFDPLFFDPFGLDGIVGTADDDYRLDAGSPCVDSGSDEAVPADVFDLDNDGDVAEPLPVDLAGERRFLDDPFSEDSHVDMGAYEFAVDCNGNGIPDYVEIEQDPLLDEDGDGLLDECGYFVADELLPPATPDFSAEPEISPATKAFYHPYEQKVYAKEPGLVDVAWTVIDATSGLPVNVTETYIIVLTPSTVDMYRTDAPNNGPVVNLSSIYDAKAEAILHYNSTIQYRGPGIGMGTPPDADAYVFSAGPTIDLYAGKAGQVLLEYRDRASQRWLGFEVVDIEEAIPYDEMAEVGDQLLPKPPFVHDANCAPDHKNKTTHIYRQDVEGPTKWNIYATRPTDSLTDIEIFWFKERRLDLAQGSVYVNWPSQYCRYVVVWPDDPQLNLYGDPGGGRTIPIVDLSTHKTAEIKYRNPDSNLHVQLIGTNQLLFGSTGQATIMYSDETVTGTKVSFDVVETVSHDNPSFGFLDWEIGKRIEDVSHAYDYYASGYIFAGTAYDPWVYEEDIFHHPSDYASTVDYTILPINRGDIEVWWYQESMTRQGEPSGVAWPSRSVVCQCDWSPTPDACIIISSQKGIGPFYSTKYLNPSIYELGTIDGDPNEIGYNPNEEHAEWDAGPGSKMYAARDDWNAIYGRSEPYVLLKYRDGLGLATEEIHHTMDNPWEMDIIRVARDGTTTPDCPCSSATTGPCEFVYSVTVGTALRPPLPLNLPIHDPPCAQNVLEAQYSWDDNRGKLWYRRGGVAATATYWENWQGTCAPWLVDASGDPPQEVTWNVEWPTIPSSLYPAGEEHTKDVYIDLRLGETEILEGVDCAEILYNETGASLIQPWRYTDVPLLNSEVPDNDVELHNNLPPHIAPRFGYEQMNQRLYYRGIENHHGNQGENLLGIMSEADRDTIKTVFSQAGAAFLQAVDDLYLLSQQQGTTKIESADAEWGIGLSAGSATQTGWVVLGYNGESGIVEPSDVQVFSVTCPLSKGSVIVVHPDCVFDEQVNVRWTGDCGGDCGPFEFYWEYAVGERPVDYDDIDPDDDPSYTGTPWQPWVHEDGKKKWVLGRNEVLISGERNPLLVLTDNWFRVAVRVPDPADYPDTTLPDYACPAHTMSASTDVQLAEGWLKRVKRALNPFDQRVQGFTNTRVETYVSMIEQFGSPYTDPIGLTCDPETINQKGLIEMYQTVLSRARSFTIDNGVDYTPANQALVLISGNLADFHMLLANEAYGDSLDPTIAISISSNEAAASIFCFQDQLPTNENSLLYEELALLRGRDGRSGTPVDVFPVFNRLYWNFTLGDGQVAYKNNYNIQDIRPIHDDGSRGGDGINEQDAKAMFPQGHGDAWGHYLTAIKFYYKLLRHPYYSWPIRTEAVVVDQVPVEVSYAHERKFARAAVAKAKCGAEIMELTYREQYDENPEEQWSGYSDAVSGRHWGVTDWARRSFMGSYFDWAVGNAILPATDENPGHQGTIKQVDRTTVSDLDRVINYADTIQAQLDNADIGLNPLGLAKNMVPFDIEPLEDESHFEQIYKRAVLVLNNTISVYDHANDSSRRLRENQDEIQEFENNKEEREHDFNSRLIEIFGYPYPESKDPFTGETYGFDYEGPDLYHWDYVDAGKLLGLTGENALPKGQTVEVLFKDVVTDASGVIQASTPVAVPYNIVPGFGMVTPESFTLERRAPGEIQLARSDMIQSWWALRIAVKEHSQCIEEIEIQAKYIELVGGRQNLIIQEKQALLSSIKTYNGWIFGARIANHAFSILAELAGECGEGISEGMPKSVGTAWDVLFAPRAVARFAGAGAKALLAGCAAAADVVELGNEHAKEHAEGSTDITITGYEHDIALQAEVDKLAEMIRQLRLKELEIYSLIEACQQNAGRYQAVIAKGARLLEERTAFRCRTAEKTTNYRYKDMAFRIFRNDALQKYRAQFDMAAMYTYLAAKAYGYETNLLHFKANSGEPLINRIIQERNIGRMFDIEGTPQDIPQVGPGLAGVLAQLNANFESLKGALGFNNPTISTDKFSLRRELYHIHPDAATGEQEWQNWLRYCQVDDLKNDVLLFNQYCNPFDPYDEGNEPAIVIRDPFAGDYFGTTIQADKNFFGWPGSTDGGESFYPSDHFSIKIRGVGVWFSNYDDSSVGLVTTPRCYLVPVGADVLRVPGAQALDSRQKIREWRIVDQLLPLPFLLGEESYAQRLNGWMPQDQMNGTLMAPQTRRHSSIRAHHDGGGYDQAGLGAIDEEDFETTTKLIGRSVWNTRWLLVIPGRFLLQGDPHEGIRRFIEGRDGTGGVTDIRLAFQTYQYSSGLGKPEAEKEQQQRE